MALPLRDLLNIREQLNAEIERAARDVRWHSLADLAEAYKQGILRAPVIVDTDTCWVHAGEDHLFELDTEDALRQALDMLGIPHEEP